MFRCGPTKRANKASAEYMAGMFILPEFVSYLGERGVLCVGNDSNFCTQVFMNM